MLYSYECAAHLMENFQFLNSSYHALKNHAIKDNLGIVMLTILIFGNLVIFRYHHKTVSYWSDTGAGNIEVNEVFYS